MNRYAYASDNPERYADPSGHVEVDILAHDSQGTVTVTDRTYTIFARGGVSVTVSTTTVTEKTLTGGKVTAADESVKESLTNSYSTTASDSGPTIGVGAPTGETLIKVYPVSLNAEQEAGLAEMDISGQGLALGVGQTALGIGEGGLAIVLALKGDPEAQVEAAGSAQDLPAGVAELQSNGPDFLAGLATFGAGTYSGLMNDASSLGNEMSSWF